MRDIEEVREFFKKDVFATETAGIVIEEADFGYALCSMKVMDKHKAAHGNVMGGAIFTLADFTFAVATNSAEKLVVTTTSNISYIGMAKTDLLYAKCTAIKDGRRVCFYKTEVYDSDNNPVANVMVTGTPLN